MSSFLVACRSCDESIGKIATWLTEHTLAMSSLAEGVEIGSRENPSALQCLSVV